MAGKNYDYQPALQDELEFRSNAVYRSTTEPLHEDKQPSNYFSPSGILKDIERGSVSTIEYFVKGKIALKRQVGLFSAVGFLMGTIIGSGIFISPKGVLLGSGSIGLTLIIWTVGGILAIMGSFCYAELGTCVPKSGGDYVYILEAYKPLNKTAGSILAFLCAWTNVLIISPAALAVVSLTFAEYISRPIIGECTNRDEVNKVLACVCVLIITFINCSSASLATRVQNIFVISKLLACSIVILIGLVNIALGSTEYLNTGFENTESSASSIVTALFSAFWAYDGWNKLNFITEEIVDPNKNFPKAIAIALPLVTVIYVLMNIAYFAAMSPMEMLESQAVAVTFGEHFMKPVRWLIPLFVVLSAIGAFNGYCFTGSRFTMSVAREGQLPGILSCCHLRKRTPIPALIFGSIITVLLIAAGGIMELINFFGFASWFFFGVSMLALIILRIKKPDLTRPYKVPLIFPVLVFLVAVFLVIVPIVQDPKIEILFAIIFILGGLLFYIPFILLDINLPAMNHITRFLQKVLFVCPTDYIHES